MPGYERDLEAYQQANDDLRQYVTLRYTVLGAFAAISGTLLVFAVEKLKGTPALGTIAMFNVVVAIALGMFEWRYNAIAEFYANKVDMLAKELGMSPLACSAPPRSVFGKYLAPLLMFPIYGSSIVMWLYIWAVCGPSGRACGAP
jgi:hypothetical protein